MPSFPNSKNCTETYTSWTLKFQVNPNRLILKDAFSRGWVKGWNARRRFGRDRAKGIQHGVARGRHFAPNSTASNIVQAMCGASISQNTRSAVAAAAAYAFRSAWSARHWHEYNNYKRAQKPDTTPFARAWLQYRADVRDDDRNHTPRDTFEAGWKAKADNFTEQMDKLSFTSQFIYKNSDHFAAALREPDESKRLALFGELVKRHASGLAQDQLRKFSARTVADIEKIADDIYADVAARMTQSYGVSPDDVKAAGAAKYGKPNFTMADPYKPFAERIRRHFVTSPVGRLIWPHFDAFGSWDKSRYAKAAAEEKAQGRSGKSSLGDDLREHMTKPPKWSTEFKLTGVDTETLSKFMGGRPVFEHRHGKTEMTLQQLREWLGPDAVVVEVFKAEELKRKPLKPDGTPPKPSTTPKWDAMTPEQQRHCQFMGFDPDNPDVPLD